jgi:hypothetical protein
MGVRARRLLAPCLLKGLDDIARTLVQGDALAAYQASHAAPIWTLSI